MNRLIRRKLTMARRALEFAQANPSTDASWTGVVSRLGELVDRADALDQEERQGRADRRTAVATRRELRDRIHTDYLRHLVTTAGVAFKDAAAVPKEFRLPRNGGPYLQFGGAAHAMLAAASPIRDQLVAAGLGETLLDELTQALAEFDAATAAETSGRRVHMTARSAMEELSQELVEQVRLLDGLLRPRIRKDPELGPPWERIHTLEGPERAGRTPVVGIIGPAAGDEMLIPAAASQGGAGSAEGSAVQESPAVEATQDDVPEEEGQRNVS